MNSKAASLSHIVADSVPLQRHQLQIEILGHFDGRLDPLYGDFDLAGRRFVVFRSRTNTDDRLHPTPEWNNIVPEELYPLGLDLQD